MAKTTFVSPGVFTRENDLSFVTSTIATTTLGLVGETKRGPAFEAVGINSWGDFKTRFGNLDPKVFGGKPKYELGYIARQYLQESNQLFVTRILGLSGYDADRVWIISTEAALDRTTTGKTHVDVPYANTGATPNNISLTGPKAWFT